MNIQKSRMSIIKNVLKSIAFLAIICFSISCNTEKEPTTTEEIIEQHLKKVGGNLLGNTIKSLKLVTITEYEDNSSVTTTSRLEFPYKLHQNDLYAGATQDYILNGDKGFSLQNNLQLKTLKPFEVRNLKESAHLMAFYRWEERHWKYEYKGKETLNNQEHFILQGINDSIRLGNRVYINTSSLRIKRVEIKGSNFEASSDFNDYFTKNGLSYPNETITDYGSYSVTTKVSDFLINPTFDPTIFEVKTAIE